MSFDAAFEYFSNEGFRPKGDKLRQTIEFRKDGERFHLQFDKDDPDFYRLNLPDFWLMADQDEWRNAKLAALQVNRTIKCACVDISEQYDPDAKASIKAELFCDNVDSFLEVWERAANSIQAARREFVKRIRETQDAD